MSFSFLPKITAEFEKFKNQVYLTTKFKNENTKNASYHPNICQIQTYVRGCVEVLIYGENIPTPKKGNIQYLLFLYFYSPLRGEYIYFIFIFHTPKTNIQNNTYV
jgi:hypothetical protein